MNFQNFHFFSLGISCLRDPDFKNFQKKHFKNDTKSWGGSPRQKFLAPHRKICHITPKKKFEGPPAGKNRPKLPFFKKTWKKWFFVTRFHGFYTKLLSFWSKKCNLFHIWVHDSSKLGPHDFDKNIFFKWTVFTKNGKN